MNGAARVIVCERSGSWATLLFRHLGNTAAVRQTRGLADCAAELDQAPQSFLAIELTRENFAAELEVLDHLGHRYPRARAVVLAERGLEPFETVFREAGAVHFTSSPRGVGQIAHLAASHLEGVAASAPTVDTATRIWQELPWATVAAG